MSRPTCSSHKRDQPAFVEGGNGAGGVRSDELRLQRFDLPGKEDDLPPLGELEGFFGGQGVRRDVVQRRLDRKEGLRGVAPMHEIGESFQGYGGSLAK